MQVSGIGRVVSGCLQRFALPHAASQCSLNASAMKREHEYNNISTYWRREAPRHLATCAEGSLDQQGVPVAVVPGTTFNIEAGRNHVLINHAQGWRDTATLQGRPGGGSSWAVTRELGAPGASAHAAAGGHAAHAAAEAGPGSSQLTIGIRAATDPARGGADDSGQARGSLQLLVPEKWMSFDIRTDGSPVSVTRVVEADLRACTRGGPMTLGTVRGLQVDLDSREPGGSPAGGEAPGLAPAVADASSTHDQYDLRGTVKGGDVSGTSVSIAATRGVKVRRLVGGTMRLLVTPTHPSSGATVELGAAYGGRLDLCTGGGDVSITTLDVGAHLHRGHSGEQLGDRTAAGEEAPTSSSDVSVGRAISNLTSGGAGSSEGCGHEAGEQGVVGGASVTTNGGAIRVDSLAGSAVLDSGGGPIKVHLSDGIRHVRLVSGGGDVEVTMDGGMGLQQLEVAGAKRVHATGQSLARWVREAAGAAAASTAGAKVDSAQQDAADQRSNVMVVAGQGVELRGSLPGEEGADGRRAGSRQRSADASATSARVIVHAGGGQATLRALNWMDAVRARMASKASAPQEPSA